MRSRSLVPAIAVIVALSPATAEAQDREGLIDQSRAEIVGSQPALDLLLAATNPLTAPIDSMWSVGVYDLADNLINIGESDLAAVWLRWAARHAAEWPIDRTWYSPVVISAYDIAAPAVESGGGLGGLEATTSWSWPNSFNGQAAGTLEIASGTDGVEITVQDQGQLQAGGTLNLPPGTYQITATASGYEDVSVSREVLPGATTVLTLDLPPVFTPEAEDLVNASLARISFTSGGQVVCRNGVIADAQGLVLTGLSGLEGATGIQVETPAGAFTEVTLGPTDTDRGIAVLRADPDVGPVLRRAPGVFDAQYAWSLYQPECSAATTAARTRLMGWPANSQDAVAVPGDVPDGAAGAPMVDSDGGLLGLVVGAGSVLPIQVADELLQRARTAVADAMEQVPGVESGGGSPTWLFVVGGLAAAAGAAVALGGGGGDGGGNGNGNGNGTPPPPPSTGSITIFFPGGPS